MSSWNRKQKDRVKRRRRPPDFVRKAGPHREKEERERDIIEDELIAMQEEEAEAERRAREQEADEVTEHERIWGCKPEEISCPSDEEYQAWLDMWLDDYKW